jgi:hypothetical protein
MDVKHEQKIYGENPLFIFGPDDASNRPVQGLHKGAISRWPFLPAYTKELFVRAFSKDILHDPANRIIEQEWLRLFIRMRAEIYKCSCGEVYFADPAAPNPCPSCGKTNAFTSKHTGTTCRSTSAPNSTSATRKKTPMISRP